MKNSPLLILLLFTSLSLSAQQERKVDSKITNVTVFLNKAQITREVKTRVEAGKTNIVVTGVTSQLDPQSIQVSGKGNFILIGITHQQNFINEFNYPPSLQRLKDSLDYVEKQLIMENNQKEILTKEEQLLSSNQKIGGANQNLTVAELKAMMDFYKARLTDILTAKIKVDEKLKKLNETRAKLQRQVNEERDLFSRNTGEIVVSVSAEQQTNVDLELNYVVQNAGWYPVYDLRAVNTKSPVQLNYKANVYQATGEEWKNVKLKLSTANPSQGGLKPELNAWYVDVYNPVVRQLKGRARGVSMMKKAEADMEVTEEEVMAAPAASLAEHVTTVQTSVNTEFNISLPYTITSSNKPTLVDIRKHDLKANYQYAVAPKLDSDAFLMAKILGWEEYSLLPGEANVFFEGTFVGKTFIDPNQIKDTLAVSMGRDKRITVKREKLQDYTSKKLIGSNQREAYAYEISVRNNKGEAIQLVVEDQIPVSQNSQIEVSVIDTANAKYSKDNGKLTWEFNIQPGETKKMVYKFELKYPKDITISGL
ncbi:DUF4139 domain-containing protein [Chryseosolibacter indicus]|uniref:Mucoidy inhibitor MuiA family protein n=1 Tax=Chryseosolibacter indicus TaxID=2782351 RepID=A0ABS5VKY6_9BACT|nr:mucoidy inhibitor MuiA family protein [Chryseosolibacter indicus]MBT1702117.1 mucoidy inhibitor MuiA family protein [Chryseosolibacter indicus]